MKGKKVLLLLLAGILMFGLVACSAEDGSLKQVKVAEVTRSIFYAPQYVAVEKGFFEEEGLEIDITTTWGGDKTMTALLSDGADIALVGSETSIYVYAQGASEPAINFAQLTQTDGTFLVAREPDDDFQWDDIKGKDYLGQRPGGMPQMVGEFVLKNNDIDLENDINLIQNVDYANIPNAFASGTGDYVQLFEPQASMFEEEGIGYIVASFGEESGKVPYTTFMTKEDYLTEDKETVKKFTRAIYKAQQWVDSASPEEIAEVVAPFFEDTEMELLATVVERYKSQNSMATDPILDEEEWNNLQNIMDESGQLPARVDYTDLVNIDIAEGVINE
ncbi:ABC transporter substrate-binding protein [Bacillus fonticola]|uniref:ABC transporter substrate-binding protein n=1 Tax=Bacillus fonticola TaxID=2728853 RepID=UPI001474E1F0|nr:ABC transporter substrate-binding protein [Bacillus fonticola]